MLLTDIFNGHIAASENTPRGSRGHVSDCAQNATAPRTPQPCPPRQGTPRRSRFAQHQLAASELAREHPWDDPTPPLRRPWTAIAGHLQRICAPGLDPSVPPLSQLRLHAGAPRQCRQPHSTSQPHASSRCARQLHEGCISVTAAHAVVSRRHSWCATPDSPAFSSKAAL